MAVRVFTLDDQQAFARLSGDRNPLHVDPILARRLLYGRPVVHGIHLMAWALNCASAARGGALAIRRLQVEFNRPVGVDEPVELQIDAGSTSDRCTIRCGGGITTTIEVEWLSVTGEREWRVPEPPIATDGPQLVPREQLATRKGDLALWIDAPASETTFPNLVRAIGSTTFAELIATSRLVGMECPGLHSIFRSLRLSGRDDDGPIYDDRLRYRVMRLDQRFNLVQLAVDTPGFSGTLEAFIRPEPFMQPAYATLASLVEPSEFAGTSALVIGGSRGIGEVAAKLLAAGGARVALTYRHGAEEAAALVREIENGGGRASTVQLDVLEPDEGLQSAVARLGRISHLCYFATGPIFLATRGGFDASLFTSFCDFYVTGFARVVQRLRMDGLRAVLYPSSSAIDELPADMAEYAAAKAAGESACASLARQHPALAFRVPRFPRLRSDQTQSLMPARSESAEQLLLPELRALYRF
jgi:NADP-dependent 3-hydroxy acid dehydrogenase YdfG